MRNLFAPLRDAVLATRRKNLVLAGLTSAVCIVFPAIAAVEGRFDVQTVADAGGSLASVSHGMTMPCANRAIAELAEARARSAEAVRLATIERREGALGYLDLLTAEQTLINADTALAASDRALSSNQIAVFKALGGGWQAP